MGRKSNQIKLSGIRKTEKIQKNRNNIIKRDEITISNSGTKKDNTTNNALENLMSSSAIPMQDHGKSPSFDAQLESKDDGSVTIWQKSEIDMDLLNTL